MGMADNSLHCFPFVQQLQTQGCSMRVIACLITLLALTSPMATADDVIPADSDRAIKIYEKAITEARSALLKGFENADMAIRNRTTVSGEKKLTLLKDLAVEKDLFVESGQYPESAEMRPYLADYKDTIGRAERALQRELDDVINALTKNREVDKASTLLAQKKAFATEAEIRKNKGEFGALLGRWAIEVPQVPFKAEWTISPDGNITATEGASLKGTWKADKDKRHIIITWEGVKIVDWLAYPIKANGTTTGGTSQKGNYKFFASKIK
jgi:hypothetical protein